MQSLVSFSYPGKLDDLLSPGDNSSTLENCERTYKLSDCLA